MGWGEGFLLCAAGSERFLRPNGVNAISFLNRSLYCNFEDDTGIRRAIYLFINGTKNGLGCTVCCVLFLAIIKAVCDSLDLNFMAAKTISRSVL